MKARWLYLVVITLVSISGSISFAEEQKKPQLFLLMQDNVKVGQEEAYIAACQEANAMFKQAGFPFSFLVYRHLSSFYSITPIDSFADLDKGMEAFQKLEQAAGSGKFKEVMTKVGQNILSSASEILMVRPDLSYEPEDPVFKTDYIKPYNLHITICHFKPETRFDAEAAFKEGLALHKNKKTRLAYQVCEVLFGPECPAFSVVIPTQDLLQYLEEGQKAKEILGSEYMDLMKKNAHLVQRIDEMMHVEFLPELCYYPEAK